MFVEDFGDVPAFLENRHTEVAVFNRRGPPAAEGRVSCHGWSRSHNRKEEGISFRTVQRVSEPSVLHLGQLVLPEQYACYTVSSRAAARRAFVWVKRGVHAGSRLL